jgi:ATP-dependent RNA helicase DeaD
VADLTPFQALGIAPPILKALAEMGFEEPSPIQVQAIPVLLAGRDVVGQAQTGTGKTAAFAIPALQRLDPDASGPQALILTPTRELALQVAEEVARIGAHLGARETAIYGGQPIERQIRALRAGTDIVVGTPGRLLDHLRRGTLDLAGLRTVVLDEGDEMLDMGFIDDIEAILQAVPAQRLAAIFSATVPPPIRRLAQNYLKDPAHLRATPERLAAPSIDQYFYEIRGTDRSEALCRILDVEDVGRAIVFCRTKRGVDELAAVLQARGYPCEAIHGDMVQPQRLRALGRFREGRSPLLVATDVAARGLDVEGVTHVINYDIAASPEAYVHRIGRTGRAGRSGVARVTQARIRRRPVPTPADVALAARDSFRRQLIEAMEGDLSAFIELARDLAEERSAVEVAAAAMKVAMDGAKAGGWAGERPGVAGRRRDQGGGRVGGTRRDDQGGPAGGVRRIPRGDRERGHGPRRRG